MNEFNLLRNCRINPRLWPKIGCAVPAVGQGARPAAGLGGECAARGYVGKHVGGAGPQRVQAMEEAGPRTHQWNPQGKALHMGAQGPWDPQQEMPWDF